MGKSSGQSYPGLLRHSVVIYYFMLFCINSINLSWLICQLNAGVCQYSYLSLYQCFLFTRLFCIWCYLYHVCFCPCVFCMWVFIIIFTFYPSVLDATCPVQRFFQCCHVAIPVEAYRHSSMIPFQVHQVKCQDHRTLQPSGINCIILYIKMNVVLELQQELHFVTIHLVMLVNAVIICSTAIS